MKRGLERSETVAGLREESGSRSRSGSDENSKNYLRADTRTPGLSRKSNSTLSLANDVDMEVASTPLTLFWKFYSGAHQRVGGDAARTKTVKVSPPQQTFHSHIRGHPYIT